MEGSGGVVEVRVLGPVDVVAEGCRVQLGPQLRTLLAALVLEPGRVLTSERLVDLLWDEPVPDGAPKTLRAHASHLRRVLSRQAEDGPSVALTSEGRGYRLEITPDQVDAFRFERLVEKGRRALAAGDAGAASEQLRAAIALWRGPALSDVGDRPFAVHAAVRLGSLYKAALQARVEADLGLGRHAEVVGELEGLLTDDPHDEVWRRLGALALYRNGRVEAAARLCQVGLEHLIEQGLDSAKLQELQRAILSSSPDLEWVPPAGAADARSTSEVSRPFQLPPDVAEFVGREADLSRLRACLDSAEEDAGPSPVMALDGRPGVGKSALAIHVAHERASQFPGGVLYADLRAAGADRADVSRVLGDFLNALGIASDDVPHSLDATAATLRSALADRQVLVVLDDTADAAQVSSMLPTAPGCASIVTSRYGLAELDAVAHLSLELMTEAEAVALLARFVGQDRVDAEPVAAATVVRRCGYLPLAVRIAGARIRARPTWPLAVLADKLADESTRLTELEAGDLAVRPSFALSYQALTDTDAEMFRALGFLDVPHTTSDVAAAMVSCSTAEAETRLERLVDAQLLETPSPGRFHLHDLVRLFARERAVSEEDQDRLQTALGRALDHYLDLAQRAETLLSPSVGTSEDTHDDEGETAAHTFGNRRLALEWLQTERDNLVAAATRASSELATPIAQFAWKLSDTLWSLFELFKWWNDWQRLTEAALDAAARAGNTSAKARQLRYLGIIRGQQGRLDEAISFFGRAQNTFYEIGELHEEARVLNDLGISHGEAGGLEQAIECYERSLTISRYHGDRYTEARTLNNLGVDYTTHGYTDRADECLQRALAVFVDIGCEEGVEQARSLHSLGILRARQRRFADAITCYEHSVAICETINDWHTKALSLRDWGNAIAALYGAEAARKHWAEALTIFDHLKSPEAGAVRTLLAVNDS